MTNQEKKELPKHYRYVREYPLNWDTEPPDQEGKIKLVEFEAIRETPSGYWIKELSAWGFATKPRFVLKVSRKRFAYQTKKEAFKSFKIRTNKSWGYAERDLNNAKMFFKLIEGFDLSQLEQ